MCSILTPCPLARFMVPEAPSTVLAIGINELPANSSSLDVYTASTVRETMATIRLIGFDLVLAGFDNPTLDIWEAIERVLAAWPQQRWILASSDVTPEEEIVARSLGAMLVLNVVPDERWLTEFVASLRKRQMARRIPNVAPVGSPRLFGASVGARAS